MAIDGVAIKSEASIAATTTLIFINNLSLFEKEAGTAFAIPASSLTDGGFSYYLFLKPAGQALVVTFLVILPFTQVMVFLAGVFTTADAAGL